MVFAWKKKQRKVTGPSGNIFSMVGESNKYYVVKAIGINIVCRRVINISCLKVTPFWHRCHEIKFRNIAPKKIIKWFLESLFKSKNLCHARFLVFVLVSDLSKWTPKIKKYQKAPITQRQNTKNTIKNWKPGSKLQILINH